MIHAGSNSMPSEPFPAGLVLRRTTFLATVLLLATVGLGSRIGWGINRQDDISKIGKRQVARRSVISEQKEAEIGEECASQFDQTAGFISDPQIIEYVERVAGNVSRNSDLKVPPTIHVIDSPEIISLTLPGGYLYVSVGMIFFLDEEGGLAGVLAHQIAHLAARHWASIYTISTIARFALLPLILDGRVETDPSSIHIRPCFPFAEALSDVRTCGMPLMFLKLARENEAEADFLGLQYMYKAGYDPHSYLAHLKKTALEEQRAGRAVPQVFSARPPTSIRISNSEKEIETLLPPHKQSLVTTSEFEDMKARLQTLVGRMR